MLPFLAKLRSDKRKNPEVKQYRYLTFEECRQLSNHCLARDFNGDISNVKITSIKTWKRKPEIEVHWKWGLYDYDFETIYPDIQQTFFCKELDY